MHKVLLFQFHSQFTNRISPEKINASIEFFGHDMLKLATGIPLNERS